MIEMSSVSKKTEFILPTNSWLDTMTPFILKVFISSEFLDIS